MSLKMDELKKQKIIPLVLAFLLGGILTYFVSDYIKLKYQTNQSTTHNSDFKEQGEDEIMKPEKDDPFAQMERIHKQMDKMFKRGFFGRKSLFDDEQFNFGVSSSFSNDLKISEREDENYKYIEIASEGFDKEGIKIDISEGMITVSGEIKKKSDNDKENSWSHSTFVSTFSRSFNVPYGVDESKPEFDTSDTRIIIKFPKI